MKFIRYTLIACAILIGGDHFLDSTHHPLHLKLRDTAARLADVNQLAPETIRLEPYGARVCFTWPGADDPEGLLLEALAPPASARRIDKEVIERGEPKDWHVGLLSADGKGFELFKFRPRFFGEVDWADDLKGHFHDQSGQPKAACLRSLSMMSNGISARVQSLKLDLPPIDKLRARQKIIFYYDKATDFEETRILRLRGDLSVIDIRSLTNEKIVEALPNATVIFFVSDLDDPELIRYSKLSPVFQSLHESAVASRKNDLSAIVGRPVAPAKCSKSYQFDSRDVLAAAIVWYQAAHCRKEIYDRF